MFLQWRNILSVTTPTFTPTSITWFQFQTQLILTTCQIRYHSHCGIIVELEYHMVSRLHQLIFVWAKNKYPFL